MEASDKVFFFNDAATTEIYTLSLHDALPISPEVAARRIVDPARTYIAADQAVVRQAAPAAIRARDRKSTRLNSSHANISYAVFCLKKKKQPNPFQCLDARYSLAYWMLL